MSVNIRGGKNLSNKLNKIRRKMESSPSALIGVPKGAGEYKDGTLIAVIAAVNEFGSADGRIPERSGIRNGIEEALPEIKALYRVRMPDVMEGSRSIESLQNEVGALATSKIKEVISNGVDPANADSTKKRKKSSTPLIDKGTYRQSISWVLSDEKAEEGL